MAHDDCRQAYPIALDNPGLRCHIAHLVGSDSAGVLDLDEPPAAPAVRLQDIGPDHYSIALEGCLEDRSGDLCTEKFCRARKRGWYLCMVLVNQDTIRIAAPREFADVMPALEPGQSGIIKMRKFAAMKLEPQAARAVFKGRDLAFGKARLIRCR